MKTIMSNNFAIKTAQDRLNKFAISLTGARPGDVLTGTSKATQGAIIRIHDAGVPPQKDRMDSIRHFPHLWSEFIHKLGAIPFFRDMTGLERNQGIVENEAENERSIGSEGSRIELVQPGKSNFVTEISEGDLEMLMCGNPRSEDGFWCCDEIETVFPRRPGSNATRHTLILIRPFWKVTVDFRVAKSFPGLVLSLETNTTATGVEVGESEEIYIIKGVAESVGKSAEKKSRSTAGNAVTDGGWERKATRDVGVLVSTSQINFKDMDELVNDIRETDMEAFRRATRGFTASVVNLQYILV